MENRDLENAFNALSDATLGMIALKENFKKLNEIENEIKLKNEKSEHLLTEAKLNSKSIESKMLQSKAILEEIKYIKKDFDAKFQVLENKEDSLIQLMKELKNGHIQIPDNSNSGISFDKKNEENIKENKPTNTHKVVIVKKNSKNINWKSSNYEWENKPLGNDKFTFTIKKHIGTLGTDNNAAELNYISWNNRPAKYDLRHFSSDHNIAKKGITMSEDFINNLKSLLNTIVILELKNLSEYKNPFYVSDKYIICEHLGTINISGNNSFELNIVSWNNNTPKFDLRSWIEGHEIANRGITLNYNEITALKNLLNEKF